ncbi:porin family protein [Lichenihabitans sp. Uapishka_5]|uniref:outer membrane protein n=1 Tax=Lichenihabitans sp. Uapishka_5 TaxID=3037302 RepID=UPI0029E7FBA1|nr:porin family protein [Lichenihabitans sp. Uapishka_5]MDX7950090.1 porin family protein [Lichenihabitans sp. Uapishka_5]
MMRSILAGAGALAALTSGAFAADLPSRLAPPVYAPPLLPAFTWTGGYFGVNAGYAFDSDTRVTTVDGAGDANGVATGFRPGSIKASADGFTGGGQIGYNLQVPGFGGGFGGPGSGIVIGVEADAAYTDLSRGTAVSLNGATSSFRTGLDYLGTVRGRFGYAFNQFMVYGTGGFAYGGVNDRANFYSGGNGALEYAGHTDDMATGYAYGGGVEYALPTSSLLNFFKSSAVTIKAEYLHYDLGKTDVATTATGANAATGTYTVRFKNEGDLARAGLNYKF